MSDCEFVYVGELEIERRFDLEVRRDINNATSLITRCITYLVPFWGVKRADHFLPIVQQRLKNFWNSARLPFTDSQNIARVSVRGFFGSYQEVWLVNGGFQVQVFKKKIKIDKFLASFYFRIARNLSISIAN